MKKERDDTVVRVTGVEVLDRRGNEVDIQLTVEVTIKRTVHLGCIDLLKAMAAHSRRPDSEYGWEAEYFAGKQGS